MTQRAPWPSITGASIFAGDPEFRVYKSDKNAQQTSTETVVRLTRETGKSPGTLTGIARKAKLANRSTNPYLHKSGSK